MESSSVVVIASWNDSMDDQTPVSLIPASWDVKLKIYNRPPMGPHRGK